jgi:hypothetical protein
MSKNPPPVFVTQATIIVSAYDRRTRSDCKEFILKINGRFGLAIKLVERSASPSFH